MEKAKSTGAVTDTGATYRRLMVMWLIALLLTGAEFAISYRWMRPNVVLGEGKPEILLIALGALALIEFALSIWLWRSIQAEASSKRDLKMAEMGYLTAWLLCVSSGLLGYVIAYSSDGRYYYAFFILAALGVLYHQPARETLVAAAPKAELKKTPIEPKVDPLPPVDETAATVAANLDTEGDVDANEEKTANG
ncbi:MAG: hypothetical protein ABIP75_15875 [Pyrinomonadaceae bacterium]